VAFEPMNRVLRGDPALAAALAQHADTLVFTDTLRTALPPALRDALVTASPRAHQLMLVTRSHAMATKLYQFQGALLSAAAAKGLNFNEIRVLVQANGISSSRVRPKAELPAEAPPALERAIRKTENEKLRNVLIRLKNINRGSDR
jgi:hypothetical protein